MMSMQLLQRELTSWSRVLLEKLIVIQPVNISMQNIEDLSKLHHFMHYYFHRSNKIWHYMQ